MIRDTWKACNDLRISFLLLAVLGSFFCFWVIILVSQMPSYASTSCYCSKLVYDVAGNKVDVVVSQTYGGVFHTFSSQLIKFCIVHPANTLQKEKNHDLLHFVWAVHVKLQCKRQDQATWSFLQNHNSQFVLIIHLH